MLEPLACVFRHGGVGLHLLPVQVHGLAVYLQISLGFPAGLCHLGFPLHLRLGLLTHGFL